MSAESNKAVVKRAIENWNKHDLESYLELYAANSKLHFLPPGLPGGLEGARLYYGGFMAGFPDITIQIEDMIAEDDKVSVRFSFRGTHQGEFMGIPPTGKSIEASGITILRFSDNKCTERWNESDNLGIMQQLGVVPA